MCTTLIKHYWNECSAFWGVQSFPYVLLESPAIYTPAPRACSPVVLFALALEFGGSPGGRLPVLHRQPVAGAGAAVPRRRRQARHLVIVVTAHHTIKQSRWRRGGDERRERADKQIKRLRFFIFFH